jgi:S1-C subfamily serine protease
MRNRQPSAWRWAAVLAALPLAGLVAFWPTTARTQEDKSKPTLSRKVMLAEKKRVQVINKVKPAVVAVMARRGAATVGNGSGVLIDADGYALTNWHVTNAAGGPLLKCGLPDGLIYDAVLVGLDKVGDVALIKLLPKTEDGKVDGKVIAPKDGKFPFAPLGDSDATKAGDWSLAMGNPFSLSTDFTPTVTFGLISGVHRYQYPAGTLLEYTDCIQIDTSINPGNSGGPLFNMEGELIGINGRGSFEKRGRVNSGVGYAISINQIKNFMGHLRAGIDADHASLGASMESESEEGALSRIVVKAIIDSDARRRGLDVGDQMVSFAGRPMTTVNQFKNVLGLFPRGWRVPITFRRDNQKAEVLVRLMGVQRGVLDDKPPVPRPGPGPRPRPVPGGPPSPAAKFYKAKEGFANYYFNEQAQKRVLGAFVKHGDFSKVKGDWTIKLGGNLLTGAGGAVNGSATIEERGAADGKSPKVKLDIADLIFPLEPLNPSEKAESFKDPPDSGGLVLAMYLYRQLLVYRAKGFTRDFAHGGVELYYPPTDKEKPDWAKIRVPCETLRGKYAGVESRWFFATQDDRDGRWKAGQLIGFEVTPDKDEDPCEVCLSYYKDIGGGRKLPSKMYVRRGGKPYGDLTITGATLK